MVLSSRSYYIDDNVWKNHRRIFNTNYDRIKLKSNQKRIIKRRNRSIKKKELFTETKKIPELHRLFSSLVVSCLHYRSIGIIRSGEKKNLSEIHTRHSIGLGIRMRVNRWREEKNNIKYLHIFRFANDAIQHIELMRISTLPFVNNRTESVEHTYGWERERKRRKSYGEKYFLHAHVSCMNSFVAFNDDVYESIVSFISLSGFSLPFCYLFIFFFLLLRVRFHLKSSYCAIHILLTHLLHSKCMRQSSSLRFFLFQTQSI